MNQGKLKRRPVVIVTVWREKNPNPASYHITKLDWIQNRLQKSKQISPDQGCQHTLAHFPLLDPGMT